jgi:hypothetical protein
MKFVIVFTFLFLSKIAFSQKADSISCTEYHVGKFAYIDSTSDSTFDVILVDRQKKYQFETNIKTNEKATYRIKWVSDCVYELEFVYASTKSYRKNRNNRNDKITIIKKIKNLGYNYRNECDCLNANGTRNATNDYEGFMRKIKK